MRKQVIKISGIAISAILILIITLLLLFKLLGPSYVIPYVINKVQQETNGRYKLSINNDSLLIRFTTMSVHLGTTEFIRDSAVNTYSNIPFLDQFDVHAKFESFNINAFNILYYAFSKKMVVDEISLIRPSILVRKNRDYNQSSVKEVQENESHNANILVHMNDSILADTLAWREFKVSGGSILPVIKVKSFKIEDALFSFYGGLTSYPIHQVKGLTFSMTGFQTLKESNFNLEDVFVNIELASSLISKNTARLTVSGIKLNPKSFHIDSLHFKHIVDKYAINAIKGFRASWLNIGVKDIDIDGLHPEILINDSLVLVNKTTIKKATIYLFKDKKESKINPAYKPLPQELIRNIPIGLKIDTIQVLDADLTIEMEAPKAIIPGRITLNNTNVIITNITNNPESLDKNPFMTIDVSTKILDQIPVKVDYTLKINSENDQFRATCKVDSFQASVLNDFLGSQFFIEFKSGSIDHLEFEFEGSKKENIGQMDFEYSKLRFRKIKGYEKYIVGKPKTGFISTVGNILIFNNRSKSEKNYKPGAIYYEKEYNRPLVHVTIMSMLSGILSSMGLNNKSAEKQHANSIHKDEKINKKELKQEKKADKKQARKESRQ